MKFQLSLAHPHKTAFALSNIKSPPQPPARQELAGILEAFRRVHDGYSADRVVVDLELNEKFIECCSSLRIPGDAKEWNHVLFNLRKRGGLSDTHTTRRTVMTRSEWEPFIHASEIAWKRLADENHCFLDNILCDPDLASKFDLFASRIASGYSAFQYRWAALVWRKSLGSGIGAIRASRLSLQPCSLSIKSALPRAAGHYLILNDTSSFFVGYSASLRDCQFLNPNRIRVAFEIMGLTMPERIGVRVRQLEPGENPFVRRARLVRQFQPLANYVPSRHEAA